MEQEQEQPVLHKLLSKVKQLTIFADDISNLIVEHEQQNGQPLVDQLKPDRDMLLELIQHEMDKCEHCARKYHGMEGNDYYDRLATFKRVYNILDYLLR